MHRIRSSSPSPTSFLLFQQIAHFVYAQNSVFFIKLHALLACFPFRASCSVDSQKVSILASCCFKATIAWGPHSSSLPSMAASRQKMRKLFSSLLPSSSMLSERAYSAAAAMAVQDYEYWELPLPVMQDTHGQRTGRGPQWIFLGSPGVGKATYASRLAKLLNVPHISMGNLLRKEASMSTAFSKELASLMRQGMLVPDDLIFSILSKRLEQKIEFEGAGFIFDGFPRTINQAEVLDQVAEIDLVVNMKLREDIRARHMDRFSCVECGGDIDSEQTNSQCCPKCKAIAPSDAAIVGHVNLLRERQRMYSSQCKPVEHYYRKHGRLLDFEVVGGIPQTWPRLLSALRLEDNEAILQHQLPM